MTSKKPSNSDTISNNLQTNSEPSTSSISMINNMKSNDVPTSTTRLTSFRAPRDLTLGGNLKLAKVTKKVYTPNINVQRNKKTEDTSVVKNEADNKNKPKGRGRGGLNDRGRGRGKTGNLTQSTGVFSEGIIQIPGRRTSSGGGRSSYDDKQPKPFIEKPKLNLNYTVDKAEEEKKLKLLLRDDFIDHEGEINTDLTPILLPLSDGGKLYKSESKKQDTEEQKEISDDEEDQEIDQKPIILENGDAVPPPRVKKLKKPVPMITPKEEKVEQTVPEVIDQKTNGYFVLRFPDCLPGFQSHDDTDSRAKEKNENHSKEQNKPEEKTEYCTLNSLKAGFLGKIQIHRSGTAKLILGENSLVMDVGSHLGFRQDVVAAKLEEVNNELINLGPIASTLICTPDFESMLNKL